MPLFRDWDDGMRRVLEVILASPATNLGESPDQQVAWEASAREELFEWERFARERWEGLVQEIRFRQTERGDYVDVSPYKHGYWYVTYAIQADIDCTAGGFLDWMRRAQGSERVPPLFWTPDRKETRPRPHRDHIECWPLRDPEVRLGNPANAQYWMASPRGRLFLVTGYREDASTQAEPGRIFTWDKAAVDVAGALRHAQRVAGLSGTSQADIACRFHWDHLEGRRLGLGGNDA